MTYDYTIEDLKERTGGCRYRVQLLDADGAAITPARATALIFSLRDVRSNTYINLHDHQDVLDGTQGVVLLDTGWMTWTMVPEDNIIVTPGANQAVEEHEATFTIKADSGDVELSWTVGIFVRALVAVP